MAPSATTTATTTSATAVVDATPAEVFAFLRDPANHALVAGDGTVVGFPGGSRLLSLGDRFGMRMRMGVPYRISSKVVEFEQDRRIAWAHLGRHRWRWEVEPADGGRCLVTETFDMSTARSPLALRVFMGLPNGHVDNVRRSVANVQAHFADA